MEFTIAIIIVALIAIVVSVLAYFVYARDTRPLARLTEPEEQNTVLAHRASQTQVKQSAYGELNLFFYTTITEKLLGTRSAGALHAVDPTMGDNIIARFPEGEYYQLYAHPQRDWDGRIFLSRELGPSPSLQLYTFNVESGAVLEQWPLNNILPYLRQAVALSPDKTIIATVYGHPNDPKSELLPSGQHKFIMFNLLTGERQEHMIVDQHLTDAYNNQNDSNGLSVYFTTETCADYSIDNQDVIEGEETTLPRPYKKGICWQATDETMPIDDTTS